MNAWVLQDTVTGYFYVSAGLELGELNKAVILRTEGSVLDGIRKRKRMMKRDLERSPLNYHKRTVFAKKRANLFDCGIKAVPLNISI